MTGLFHQKLGFSSTASDIHGSAKQQEILSVLLTATSSESMDHRTPEAHRTELSELPLSLETGSYETFISKMHQAHFYGFV